MGRFWLRKLLSAAVTLLLASLAVFSLLRLAPGDPATVIAGADASPDQIAQIRADLGLDLPLVTQYLDWLAGLLTGTPGESYQHHRPIGELVVNAAGGTLELALIGAIMLLAMGLAMGLALAAGRPRWLARGADLLSTMALSFPVYVSAVLLIFVFAVQLRVLPAGGELSLFAAPDLSLQYLVMPAFAIALPGSAVLGRLLATEIRKVRQEEFVLTAVAKGTSRRRITRAHVLPNSLTPFVVEYGIRLGDLLGGAVIAEALFARNGLGKLLLDAVANRDYPMAQTLLMLAITVAIVMQLVTDLSLLWLDPRARSVVTA